MLKSILSFFETQHISSGCCSHVKHWHFLLYRSGHNNILDLLWQGDRPRWHIMQIILSKRVEVSGGNCATVNKAIYNPVCTLIVFSVACQ